MYKVFEKRARDILNRMTLKEKIGQLNQITITPYNKDMEELYQLIENGEVGSIILASSATAGNDKQGHVNTELYDSLQKIAVEKSRLGIPMIYGRDVIHGHRTVYPLPLAFSASFNDDLVERCYSNIAVEALSDGIHWTFAPMIDLCHDPRWGRVVEGFGEDPFLGASMAKACINGLQGNDLADKKSMAACAKHFVGYGASEGGKDYFRTEISDVTLQNYYLPAFRAAVDAGVATVMSSFNDINGIPVSGSHKYLTDILKNKLGFDGFVVSDWGAVEQLQKQGVAENRAKCAEIAITAGVDLNMCDKCYIENLENLVKNNFISTEIIDNAVVRILGVKLAMGLFEYPYREKLKYNKNKHREDARTLATESMVLLKNNEALPLNIKQNIVLLGPFSHERRSLLGTWMLDGSEDETLNFAEALSEKASDNKITIIDNYNDCDLNTSIFEKADVILLALGESHLNTGEAHSISDISLSANQVELVRKIHAFGKKTIGIFFSGRPMALGNVENKLDAILYAWHSGSETAHAVCDILFADAIPSGKTPISFPRKSTHIPLYYNITSSGRNVNGYYGEHPESNYVDGPASPLYPFGFGLSYAKFKYNNLIVDKDGVSIENIRKGEKFSVEICVSNVGNYDGYETVQLYIRDKFSSVMRPLRELKSYKKLFIKKNCTVKVKFLIGFENLGFYNQNGEYILEKGDFEIYVGDSCLTKNLINIKIY